MRPQPITPTRTGSLLSVSSADIRRTTTDDDDDVDAREDGTRGDAGAKAAADGRATRPTRRGAHRSIVILIVVVVNFEIEKHTCVVADQPP